MAELQAAIEEESGAFKAKLNIPPTRLELGILFSEAPSFQRIIDSTAAIDTRGLALRDADKSDPRSTASLHQLVSYLSQLGRFEEVIIATMASMSPSHMNADLASSLQDYDIYLSKKGKYEEAVTITQAAVDSKNVRSQFGCIAEQPWLFGTSAIPRSNANNAILDICIEDTFRHQPPNSLLTPI